MSHSRADSGLTATTPDLFQAPIPKKLKRKNNFRHSWLLIFHREIAEGRDVGSKNIAPKVSIKDSDKLGYADNDEVKHLFLSSKLTIIQFRMFDCFLKNVCWPVRKIFSTPDFFGKFSGPEIWFTNFLSESILREHLL